MQHKLIRTVIALALGASAYNASADPLQDLINAARKEAPITVYASTGKIVQQAQNFSKKYGIKAVGIKAKAPQIIEIIDREYKAHNVKADVALIEDTPAGTEQLLQKGEVQSWVPEDMKTQISAHFQNPLVVVQAPNVLAYNSNQFSSCPITNIWQLTEKKWRGHIAMQDPTGKPAYTDWFSQMATHYDAAMRSAYKAEFGHELNTDEDSAMAAFVVALAKNRPLLTHSDTEAAAAIGSPDATTQFVGLVSTAKFRKNKDGMKLAICSGVNPVIGWNYPALGVITTGTNSPNASKLFIHYLLSKEGIAPQAIDGKMSTNNSIRLPANEASGIEQFRQQLMTYQTQTSATDWQHRQDWQDLWSLNYQR